MLLQAQEVSSVYDPDIDDEKDEEEVQSRVPWYMFDSNGTFLSIWNHFYSLLVMQNFVLSPLVITFPFLILEADGTENSTYVVVETSMEFLWCLSFVIELFRA